MCAIFAGPLQTTEVCTSEACSFFLEHRAWQSGKKAALVGAELTGGMAVQFLKG